MQKLHLIDFGLTKKYLDDCNQHIMYGDSELFSGNILFGSVDQLSFKITSRKDDIISFSNMILFLLNGCQLPGNNNEAPPDGRCNSDEKYLEKLQLMKEFKINNMIKSVN